MRWPSRAFVSLVICVSMLAGAGCTSEEPTRTTLRVLASSELADMRPLLDELQRDTGIDVVLDYRGTVDASTEIATGTDDHDVAWLSDDRYLQLKLNEQKGRLSPLSTEIMTSPVVFGVQPKTEERLRRNAPGRKLSWSDIADGAASGLVRFGMPDPRHANSGLVALVGVATAAAGTGSALRPQDVTCDSLRGLFSGQTLTATTSDKLISAYVADQSKANALIGYESTLRSLNASGKLREPLKIVYPEDGTVLSRYPLLLLKPSRRAAYDKVVAWLTRPDTQRKIMQHTLRRPIDPGVPRDPRLRSGIGNSLYFPNQAKIIDSLLANYSPSARPQGQVIFVLDHSRSMKGAPTKALRSVFEGLSGNDSASTGEFVRSYQGETFTLIDFDAQVRAERGFTVGGPHDARAIRDFLTTGEFGQNTAIWSALDHAYRRAGEMKRAAPGRPVTIVLMTDGLNNAGISLQRFLDRYRALPAGTRAVHTYPIKFGGADPAELDRAAKATGGRMVDANAPALGRALKETRGCR